MSPILTVDPKLLSSIRDEAESSALLKAFSHDHYTVYCRPCGWSKQFTLTELFAAPEFCPRCEFPEEDDISAMGIEILEQLHFSSPDHLPAEAPKGFVVFKDELVVDGCIEIVRIMLEERHYWAGVALLLGHDWTEFLEFLAQPLEYEVAFEQLAKGYVNTIGLSAEDRTIYWDSIMCVTLICQMNCKGRSYAVLTRCYDLIASAIERKINERFQIVDTSDIGLLSLEKTLQLMVKEFQAYSSPQNRAMKHALAYGIYSYMTYLYVENDKYN